VAQFQAQVNWEGSSRKGKRTLGSLALLSVAAASQLVVMRAGECQHPTSGLGKKYRIEQIFCVAIL